MLQRILLFLLLLLLVLQQWSIVVVATHHDGAAAVVVEKKKNNNNNDNNNKILDFEIDFGGIPNDKSPKTCQYNTELLSRVLQNNASNSILHINSKTFHFHHGVYARYVQNAVIKIDGIMRFERNETEIMEEDVTPCFMLDQCHNITLTSSDPSNHRRGLIDGRGSNYWGVPVVGYLELEERRPRLIRFNLTTDLVIEHLIFQDSPYHTIFLEGVENVIIRHISIVARRTHDDGHNWIDLSAFNTDGIDVSGSNIHIHDSDIWVQDDCIAIKDNYFGKYESKDMLIENVNCSGLGFVVGSIGGTHVSNITFRNSYLHKSVKGIYLKFNQEKNPFWQNKSRYGIIEHVQFQNITMERPIQWPIWIGPAQQSDRRRPCHANPCSLCWPQDPMAHCHVVHNSQYRHLELTNVIINNPKMSPGVILGGRTDNNNTMHGIVFDSVKVTKGPPLPQALVKRTVTFPGLLQPIVDHFVPNNNEMVNMAAVASNGRDIELLSSSSSAPTAAELEWLLLDNDEEEQYATTNSVWAASPTAVLSVAVFVASLLVLAHATGFQRATASHVTVRMQEPLLLHSTTNKKKKKSVDRCRHTVVPWVVVLSIAAAWMIAVLVPWGKPKWTRTNRYFRCTGVDNGVALGDTWPVPSCFENLTPHSYLWPSTQGEMVTMVAVAVVGFVAVVGLLWGACRCSRKT